MKNHTWISSEICRHSSSGVPRFLDFIGNVCKIVSSLLLWFLHNFQQEFLQRFSHVFVQCFLKKKLCNNDNFRNTSKYSCVFLEIPQTFPPMRPLEISSRIFLRHCIQNFLQKCFCRFFL